VSEADRIRAQLDRVEALLGDGSCPLDARAAAVSSWSIAQQLDHLLKVLEGSFGRLSKDRAPSERPLPGINLLGRVLLACGRLPRGRGKAPRGSEGEERSAAELAAALARVRAALARLETEPERLRCKAPVLRHPYFGGLDPRQSLRMLAVHTDHHLRIVADIRRAAERA
jgi:hypothetical protein